MQRYWKDIVAGLSFAAVALSGFLSYFGQLIPASANVWITASIALCGVLTVYAKSQETPPQPSQPAPAPTSREAP